MSDALTSSLAAAVRTARMDRQLSASGLAERAGISRSMVTKIEQVAVQPTAALLGKLSAALGLTLSELVARAERGGSRLARAADQPTWTDPDSGYHRRAVSPATGGPLGLTEVELPPHAAVTFPAGTFAFIHQQVWVLSGRLDFRESDTVHHLEAGDCIEVGPPAPVSFTNPDELPCRYLVAVARR